MTTTSNIQTFHTSHNIQQDLKHQYYSLIRASDFDMSEEMAAAWQNLLAQYPEMPVDRFLPDGGTYRFRRYDSFKFDPTNGALRLLPHQTYYQDQRINAVTGGIDRDFAPLTPAIANNAFLHALIRFDFDQFPITSQQRQATWRVDVHLIRVLARSNEAGQPTPEGVHRDGAAFVTVHLAELQNVTGGDVSVYDDDKQLLDTFTLHTPLDAYLFRDEVLWHGVTPIKPIDPNQTGVRSILTFDYHAP